MVQRTIECHGLAKVRKLAPEFTQLSETLDQAKTIVIESRGDRARRIEIYDQLANQHVPKLIELYRSLSSHSELKLPEGEIKKGLQLVTILTGIGVLAAVGTFLIHLWGWFYPGPDIEQIRSAVEQIIKAR